MLVHTWNVLCFFPGSIQSRIHNKTFALNASALQCSYGALYQALNERTVSDLSASAGQEIRKDVAVLASLEGSPHRKVASPHIPHILQFTQREPQVLQPEAPSVS
jgi:hypothetical protein